MGADLYIEPIYQKNQKHKPVFDAACRLRDEAATQVRAYEALVQAWTVSGNIGAKRLPVAQRNLTEAKAALEAAQAEVDKIWAKAFGGPGYFRDSYNGTSVLWRLELSWWKDAPHGKPTAEQLRSFRAKIVARTLKPVTVAAMREMDCTVDDGENSPKAWAKYFRNKKRRLVRFLDRAIKVADTGGKVVFSC